MTKKILFICHGNICRSPMAEFITKKIVKDLGKENEYEIASAAMIAIALVIIIALTVFLEIKFPIKKKGNLRK